MTSVPLPPTGNTTHTAPDNRVFYPALDGLRAVAFLMVFGQHYLSLPWGWTGVNIFFVLSGFLITGILWDTRDRPHRARNFYIRRTLRIFPLYYGIVLVFLVTAPFFHWIWSPLWLAWPLYLGNFLRFLGPSSPGSPLRLAGDASLESPRFLHNPLFFGHFWSLCVEEQFYLIWPWIVFSSLSRRTLLWICGTVVVISPFLRSFVDHRIPHWMSNLELTYRFTPLQLDSLLLGGLIALLCRGRGRAELIKFGCWSAPIGIAIALILIGLASHSVSTFAQYPYPGWRQTWGLTIVNLLAATVILCALHPGHFLSRFLSLPPLRWMGRISYGAYVFHDILHNGYIRMLKHSHLRIVTTYPDASAALIALVATMLIAFLSFRFFESPFLNLKERLTAGT